MHGIIVGSHKVTNIKEDYILIIGVPREIKASENRVGLTPGNVATLVENNRYQHIIFVNAGVKLVCDESNTVEDFKEIAKQSELLICSTCLNYYELEEKVAEILPSFHNYLWEEQFDASQEDTTSFYIPCSKLVESLKIQQKIYDGYFYNDKDELIIFDSIDSKSSKSRADVFNTDHL